MTLEFYVTSIDITSSSLASALQEAYSFSENETASEIADSTIDIYHEFHAIVSMDGVFLNDIKKKMLYSLMEDGAVFSHNIDKSKFGVCCESGSISLCCLLEKRERMSAEAREFFDGCIEGEGDQPQFLFPIEKHFELKFREISP